MQNVPNYQISREKCIMILVNEFCMERRGQERSQKEAKPHRLSTENTERCRVLRDE